MKLLLYCSKAKPYLFKRGNQIKDRFDTDYFLFDKVWEDTKDNALNGKIVGECDFEVEEINIIFAFHNLIGLYDTDTLTDTQLEEKSCLSFDELKKYLGDKYGYAIHIKNLTIYDTPKELSDFTHTTTSYNGARLKALLQKAPQNMMYAYGNYERYVLISIQPQWLGRILNGEKTIEVRRKVLKEMLQNDGSRN